MSTLGFTPLPDGVRGLSGYGVHPAEWRLAQLLGLPGLPEAAAGIRQLMLTREGSDTLIKLSQMATYRADGRACQIAYRAVVRELAEAAGIPPKQVIGVTQHQVEVVRTVLAVARHIPFNPAAWDTERADA